MEKRAVVKIIFALFIVAMLVMVGTLSYYYLGGGQAAYTGDTGDVTPPPTAVTLAPAFTYVSVNSGSTVSLAALTGKVVILDFMAMWCGPCGTQMTYLKQIDGEYGPDVVIISLDVDLDESATELAQYRIEKGASWDFVMDANQIRIKPEYDAMSIPTLVFIGKNGAIAKRNVGVMGVEDMKAIIDPLL